MSKKLMHFLTNNDKEIKTKKVYFDEEDEINLQNLYDENQNDNYINFAETNEKGKKFIIDELKDNSDEIESQNKLKEIPEVEFNSNKEQEDELPLITLNFISVCQCCKNKFDKKKNLPYLFKCGHFFCVNCINQYFTDKTGIVCPTDGLVAKSISELTFLKNLIIDSKNQNYKNLKKLNSYLQTDSSLNSTNKKSNNNSNINNYCPIHKNQKLTHIVNETNEIICVHCAFEKLKSNLNLKIKEIKEKYIEYNDNLEVIINNGQKNIELIQNTLELIDKNKENEEKKMNIFYNSIIKYIEEQKKERKEQIDNINKTNKHDLEQKLLIFNEIVKQSEELKNLLEKEDDNNQNYSKILNNYNNILKLNKSNDDDNTNNKLKYIKFSNENENNIKNFLSKMSNLNIIYRIIKLKKNGKIPTKSNEKLNKIKKIESKLIESNSSSINYHRSFGNIKRVSTNIKNISTENLYDNNFNIDDNNRFNNKNNSMNIKENNWLEEPLTYDFSKIHNFKNKINNNTKKSSIINKTPFITNHYEKKIQYKKFIRGNKSHTNNNKLLENYFELKNKEKSTSINNYDSFKVVEKKTDNQKNNKSFNNLNILNNFYNIECSKKNPFNKTKKKIDINNFYSNNINCDMSKIKMYSESPSKLIPQQINQFDKDFNFQ